MFGLMDDIFTGMLKAELSSIMPELFITRNNVKEDFFRELKLTLDYLDSIRIPSPDNEHCVLVVTDKICGIQALIKEPRGIDGSSRFCTLCKGCPYNGSACSHIVYLNRSLS